MGKVLFEVKEENLETGLRGYPVGYCVTSSVDPQKGLFYGPYPISEVVHWEPLEVLYLLYTGKKGDASVVAAFEQELKKRRPLASEVKKSIEALPKTGHPMKLFSIALLLMGAVSGKGDYKEDALNLVANIEELVAIVINHHSSFGATPPLKEELPIFGAFSSLLQVPNLAHKGLEALIKPFAILHFDHGGGNLSTFVGKAVASGHEDLYGSIAAAMNALAGPLHGRANQSALAMVEELGKKGGENATEAEVEKLLRERLNNKELLYGFGHAVLKVEDPRATFFYGMAQEHYPKHPLTKMALMIREAGTRVLKENPKVTNPYPNVDAISGALLSAAGFPYPLYYTLLFGLSRACGIAMQILYERLVAREGKGTPIVRPKYIYKERG